MATRIKTSKQFNKYTEDDIAAVFEHAQNLACHILDKTPEAVTSSSRAKDLVKAACRPKTVEEFCILTLNTANVPIKHHVIATGTLDAATVYPRTVLERALDDGAKGVIAYHNHPSGTLSPSVSDDKITNVIKEALGLVDIHLVDHFIATSTQVYSYVEAGKL